MTYSACSQVITSFLFQNCPFALDIQKNKKIKFLERVCAGPTVSFGGVKLVYLWCRAFWESMQMSLDVTFIVEVKLKLAVPTAEQQIYI